MSAASSRSRRQRLCLPPPATPIPVLEEETARLGLGLPPYYDSGGKMGSASIRVWGTEEQKQRFLPPIYRGAVRSWQLLTEPSAGSDLAGVRTTAIRDGDVYVVNGQKIYMVLRCLVWVET